MAQPNEGPSQALRQQLTERFNVAIEQDDPSLMTLTATLTIAEEANKLAHKIQMENLQRYSSELEMIHPRWSSTVGIMLFSTHDAYLFRCGSSAPRMLFGMWNQCRVVEEGRWSECSDFVDRGQIDVR